MKRWFYGYSFLLTIPTMVFMVWALNNIPPASHYFVASNVFVNTAAVGEVITLEVNREIRRPFIGRYYVQVRVHTTEGWVVHCEGSGGGSYRTDTSLPNPLTLGWWANNDSCNTIDQPGNYKVTTVWHVRTPFGWRTTVPLSSNVFVITNGNPRNNQAARAAIDLEWQVDH